MTTKTKNDDPRYLWIGYQLRTLTPNRLRNGVSLEGGRKAFTLVELLVVIAVIGLLTAILAPAVQQVRESARKTHCANNLRQLGLAIQNFEAVNTDFPVGATFETGHSWITQVLPYMEQQAISEQLDLTVAWNDPVNHSAVFTDILTVQCPSSNIKKYKGYTDYCGLSGTTMFRSGKLSIHNGIFFPADRPEATGVDPSQIFDGTSRTIAVVEAVAVTDINFGYWASGWHCFTQDDGGINNLKGGFNEIASLHPHGANVLFADASTHFLTEQISLTVLSALCTRNGREVVGSY